MTPIAKLILRVLDEPGKSDADKLVLVKMIAKTAEQERRLVRDIARALERGPRKSSAGVDRSANDA